MGTTVVSAVAGPSGPAHPLAHPDEVVELIPRKADVIVPLANGEPVSLLDALDAAGERLDGLRVHQMHALHDRPYLHGTYGDHLRHISYFLSPVTRPVFAAGGCELVPCHFSEVPAILAARARNPTVLAAASLPDRHGYFLLGTNADYVAGLIGKVCGRPLARRGRVADAERGRPKDRGAGGRTGPTGRRSRPGSGRSPTPWCHCWGATAT